MPNTFFCISSSKLRVLGRLGGIVPHGEWQPHPLDGYDPTWFPLVYLAHIWLHESACVRQRHTLGNGFGWPAKL
ncbi:hypothetical protein PoB_004187600, partial [Plakobranchus ocellatus]